MNPDSRISQIYAILIWMDATAPVLKWIMVTLLILVISSYLFERFQREGEDRD